MTKKASSKKATKKATRRVIIHNSYTANPPRVVSESSPPKAVPRPPKTK